MSSSAMKCAVSQEIGAIIKRWVDWRISKLSQLSAVIKNADTAVIEDVKWKKPPKPEGISVWSRDGMLCMADTVKNSARLDSVKCVSMRDTKRLFSAHMESEGVRVVDFDGKDGINGSAPTALVLETVERNKNRA